MKKEEDCFLNTMSEYFNRSDLRLDKKLNEIEKLDSLGKLKIVSFVEDAYSLEIPDVFLTDTLTLADLFEIISKGKNKKSGLPNTDYRPKKVFSFLRPTLQFLFMPLLQIFMHIQVFGKEKLLGINSPHIFVSNHVSNLDTPVIIMSLPNKIRKKIAFAAAADIFYGEGFGFFKIVSTLLCEILFNIFPFSRKKNLLESIRRCESVISSGNHVFMYPESKRSTTGEIIDFKSGIGILIQKAKVPVVPIHIDGMFKILKKGEIIPNFGKVVVKIGDPIFFDNSKSYFEISQSLKKIVQDLAIKI